MPAYQDIKRDVSFLAEEIVKLGGSPSGGFDRAAVEYWLEPYVLLDPQPTPLPVKLAAALAICALKVEAGLPIEAEDQAVIQELISHISPASVTSSFSASDAKELLAESQSILAPEVSNAVAYLFSAAGA